MKVKKGRSLLLLRFLIAGIIGMDEVMFEATAEKQAAFPIHLTRAEKTELREETNQMPVLFH